MSIVKNKIFISHASADSELIDAFVRFLKDGFNMSHNDFFCTSISGTLKLGYDFIPQIKDNLINCSKVIFLISESYLNSFFCIAELGAAWATEQNICPLIIPPVKFSDLDRTPLLGIQALSIVNIDDIAVLRDSFIREGIIEDIGTHNFVVAANELIARLNAISAKAHNILKPDKQGYVIATVVENANVHNGVYPCCAYKLKEQIDIGQNHVESKAHWIAHPQTRLYLTAGDKIKFRPTEAHEDSSGYRGDRIFITSNAFAYEMPLK